MATTTRTRFRTLLQAAIGFHLSVDTTSAGAGGGTTVVSTNAQSYEDHIQAGMWLYIVDSTAAATGQCRRISSISGATFTVETAFSAQIETAKTVEFLEFHVDWLHDAIGVALRRVYPTLYLPLLDETLIVDDLLSNSDFETFSGGSFTGWTLGGASAADDEDTTIKRHGDRSAKLTSASAVAQLYQNVTINVKELIGRSIRFERWVAAIDADVARIGFEFASGVTDYHAYHGGEGAAFNQNAHWDWQSHTATVPTTAQYVRAICEVATGTKIGYFDGPGGVYVDRIFKYTVPTSFHDWPSMVKMQATGNPEGPFDKLVGRPKAGRLLRLEGEAVLSIPSSDTGTSEVSEHQAELIVAMAAEQLFTRLRRVSNTQEFDDDAAYWRQEVGRLGPDIKMIRMPSHKPNGEWKYGEDTSGRYLLVP